MRYTTLSLGLFLGAMTVTSANAADAVTGEPAPPEAPPIVDTTDWGGYYIGIYGGYSWISPDVAGFGEGDGEGFRAGGYTGYNWEFDQNIVAGFELNGGFSDADDSTAGVTVDQDWDASLRARLGYAFESSLIYSFAGLAVTGVDAQTITGSDSETLTGFNVGAGWEFNLVDDWTARVEYGFSDYSSESFALGAGAPTNIDLEEQNINLGIGLKF